MRKAGTLLTLTATLLISSGAAAFQSLTSTAFTSVSAGGFHTCGLSESGAAFCWGLNIWGQAGSESVYPDADALPAFGPAAYGQPGVASVPSPTAVVTDLLFSSITAGDRHSCALTHEGEAYCWGHNRFGQVGDGTTENRSAPTPVAGELTFSRISAGGTHTCALTPEGVLYCWGGNWHGQTGVGRESTQMPLVVSPVRVATSLRFQDIATGGIHTCGLDTEGGAHCWGDRRDGVLGTGQEEPEDVFTPRPVASAVRYRSLSHGTGSPCAITEEGALHCWGRVPTASGEVVATAPRRIFPPHTPPIGEATTGPGYICAVTHRDTLLGLGASSTDAGCTSAALGSSRSVSEVSAGGNAFGQHTCALMDGGQVQCWGDNSRGQLGGSAPGIDTGDGT